MKPGVESIMHNLESVFVNTDVIDLKARVTIS